MSVHRYSDTQREHIFHVGPSIQKFTFYTGGQFRLSLCPMVVLAKFPRNLNVGVRIYHVATLSVAILSHTHPTMVPLGPTFHVETKISTCLKLEMSERSAGQ